MICDYCKQKITFWDRLFRNYYKDDDGAITAHKQCRVEPKVGE